MEQFAAQEIGDRIRQARNERGLTQDELAAMASFSKRSLQDYESGVTIPYRHLRELGRLLGHREEWFLYGESTPQAAPAEAVAEILEKLDEVLRRLEQLERRAGLPEQRAS